MSAAFLGLAPPGASAATITVNSTADTAADDDSCTLREAIDSANDNVASGAMANECAAGQAAPTLDNIIFDMTGPPPFVFAPASGYGPIDEPVQIDGREDSLSASVEIDASALSFPPIFLETTAAGSQINDITVYDVTTASGDGFRSRADDVVFLRVLAGTDIAGNAHGNGGDGIEISGDNNDVLQSLSSDNGGAGIRVTPDAFVGKGGANTTIAGSRIGTTPNGTAALDNAGGGIVVTGTPDDMPDGTVIGGPVDPTPGGICDGDCNLISGNTGDGISVTPGGVLTGLQIRGNFVGTGVGGLSDLGNTGAGMHLGGGITGGIVRNNLIAGNGDNGLEMFPGTTTAGAPSNTTIAGNRIGVDREGDDPLANDGRGIVISATVTANTGSPTGNVIGGTTDPTPGGVCDGDCNVISGNGLDGIELFRSAGGEVTGTQVLGNHIGVDAAGTSGVDNNQWGVVLGGVTNTVIGSAQAPNVISGNGNSGMLIQENAAGGNVVQSNLIGLGSDGITEVVNGESGIAVFSGGSGVLIGGTAAGQGNTIARNTEAGVAVAGLGSPSASVPIVGNSIHTNPGLGIDLMPDGITFGVTPNDGAGDPDAGGNGLQNFPDLTTVAVAGGSTYVVGSLDTTAATRYRIDVYANTTADPSGHGEGVEPLGGFEVTTDGGGHADLLAELVGTAAAGKSVTATATELDGAGAPLRTSEFATNVAEGCDIVGTAGADTLTGTGAREVICGLGGNDALEGRGGDDVLVGGDGTDSVSYAAAAGGATIDLGAGTATAAGAGNDALREIENATGSAFDDRLTSVAAGSGLTGLGGADTLTGAAGPDTLDGGDGDDTLSGGDGNDALTGGTGTDTANGEAGDDAITGDDGEDTLSGGGGNDSIDGGAGADSAGGDAGDDEVLGQADDDQLFGGDGTDTVKGSGGRDDLEGGAGEDTVTAGGGDKDEARGQGGADTVKGGGGKKDDVRGGGGNDQLNGGGGKNDECDGGGGTDLTPAPGCESEKSIP